MTDTPQPSMLDLSPIEHVSKIVAHLGVLRDHKSLSKFESSDVDAVRQFAEDMLNSIAVNHKDTPRKSVAAEG